MPKSQQSGILITAVTGILCFSLIIALYPRYNTELIPLVIVPILVGAWTLEWRAATVSTLYVFTATFLVNTAFADVSVALQQLFSFGALSSIIAAMIMGAIRLIVIRSQEQSTMLAEERAALRREITERQHAEQALRQSEARYRAIVEDQTELICRFQPDGALTFANQAYCQYFEKEYSELVGHTCLPLIPEEDRAFVTAQFNTLNYSNPVTQYEHRVMLNNGETRWMQWTDRAIFDEASSLVEFQSVGRDVTAQKLAEAEVQRLNADLEQRVALRTTELAQAIEELRKEIAERQRVETDLLESRERLQLALSAAQAGVWVWNIDANQITWSDENYRLIGLQPGSLKPRYNDWLDRIHPDDREAINKQINDTIGAASNLDVEFRVIWPDGRIRWLSGIGQMRLGENGQPEAMYGIQMDITERKRIEAEIRASLHEKEALLKEIHHRVKNNLQVIASMLNLQSTYLEDAQAQSLLQESQNRVIAMATIHEKLYQSKNLARIDFGAYIHDLTAQLLSGYMGNDHTIQLKVVAEDIWLSVNTAVPCGLILNELVSNALKHAFLADQTKKLIKIRFHRIADNRVRLCVADNGVGIASRNNPQQTNTLGLQLVYTLVGQLGGSLKVENRNGATFELTFPISYEGIS